MSLGSNENAVNRKQIQINKNGARPSNEATIVFFIQYNLWFKNKILNYKRKIAWN